jgi:hypothetical protein
MASTTEKVSDTAANVKPFVERALRDEKLRDDLLHAFTSARQIYEELVGSRGVTTIASRVATDKDMQEQMRNAVEDLRSAAGRLQGRPEKKGRNTTLLIAGIALGILFNPVTGPETRRWLKDVVTGGSDDFGGSYSAGGSNGS